MSESSEDNEDEDFHNNLERLFTGVGAKKKHKKQPIKHELKQQISQLEYFDSKYIFDIKANLVRIEYPGKVVNLDRALETLGHMQGIQKAVTEYRTKLELHFHPANIFNKPCVAERDGSAGILIKVKLPDSDESTECEYDVIGVTAFNFKFTRGCDFQYLPLVAKEDIEETEDSDIDYIYEKILPAKLPTIEWFEKPANKKMKTFLLPSVFCRFEFTQNKLYLNAGEKFTVTRPEITNFIRSASSNRSKLLTAKQISMFVDFQKLNVEVPEQPLALTMNLIKERHLFETYKTVKALFDERPVYTRAAILYKGKVSLEHSKVVLPALAYFCVKGPWRSCWIRFGYNPQKDFSARIYQSLDFRIRAAEGTKLKVNVKRNYASKTFLEVHDNSRNFQKSSQFGQKMCSEERGFILRPNTIPPARQLFYQYCDILLPEIQDMFAKLPKVPMGVSFDPKNGWLPRNFTEQCREIANKYVLRNVQNELMRDQEDQSVEQNETEKDDVSTYCSRMLNNIKSGFFRNVGESSRNRYSNQKVIDTIDLVEDASNLTTEDAYIEENLNDVIINSIPERLSEEEYGSDLDIDMEVVDEVNQMIATMNEDN